MRFTLNDIIECDPIKDDSKCSQFIQKRLETLPQSDRLECWTEMDQQMCSFDQTIGRLSHVIQHFLSETDPESECKSCAKRPLDRCLRENCQDFHEAIIQACKKSEEGGFGDRGCKASQRVLSCPAFTTEGGRMRCRNYQKCARLGCYQDIQWPLSCLETHCRQQLQDFQLSCALNIENQCSTISSTILCSNLRTESDRHFCFSLFTCGSQYCSLPDPRCVEQNCAGTSLLHYEMCSQSETCSDAPFSPLSYGPEATHRCTEPDSSRHSICLNAEKCTSHCPYIPQPTRDPLSDMDASWASFLFWLCIVSGSLACIIGIVVFILKRTKYWNLLKERLEHRFQKKTPKLPSIQEFKEKEKLYLPDAKLDFGDIFEKSDIRLTPHRLGVSDVSTVSEFSEETST